MMKSFFKKLAFVMALAMVVSAMAPAATASAAEALGIVLQDDNTWTVLETYEAEVGVEVVDFRYKNAPSDYAKLSPEWDSSDKTVATVDKYGKVTTLKAGETTISIALSNGQKGELKLTVKAPVNPDAFEAKQKSHITFDVNFNKEVNYGRDNVNLYRVFETDKGDVYVVWAVRKATLSADKKTLTVEPYVQFNDGERYLVAFEDIETKLNNGSSLDGIEYDEFTVRIGDIDTVEIDWYSTVNGQKIWADSDELQGLFAYTNGEEAEEDIETTLTYKLFCGDIDLTEIYKNDGYLEFTMGNESEYIVLSDDTLVFTKAGEAATIEAVYTFENSEGEEATATSSPRTIIAKQLPPFAIEYVKEWSFTNQGDWSWSAPVHSIRAGKVGTIALLVVDNRGNQWETVAKDGNIPEFGADETETEEMYLRFYSTHTDYFLVDTEDNVGRMETYTKLKKAVVYVALHDEALLADSDYDFVRNIGACVIEIKDPVKFAGVAVFANDDNDGNYNEGSDKKTSEQLVTDAVVDPANPGRFVDEFTEREYVVRALDQDGNIYNPSTDRVLTDTVIKYTISTTNKDMRELFGDDTDGYSTVVWLDEADEDAGNVKFFVDSEEIRLAEIKNSSISFKITATQYDETGKELAEEETSFKLSLRDPELYDADDTIPGAWLVGDVKPTSWNVQASDTGIFTLTGSKSADIVIPMLSKSYTVGYYNRFDMSEVDEAGDRITIVEDSEKYLFGKDTTKGDKVIDKFSDLGIYVLVVDPDGKAVKAATSSAASGAGLGVYVVGDYSKNPAVAVRVAADDNGDGDLDYLKTGKYTVKTTFVTKVNYDETGAVESVEYKTRTDNFEVTNDLKPVEYLDMYEVTTSLNITDTNDKFAENTENDIITNIIQENFKFAFNKVKNFDQNNDGTADSWQPTDAQIRDVSYFVRGGYITFKSITFQIESGDSYYVYTLRDINKSVQLGVEEE